MPYKYDSDCRRLHNLEKFFNFSMTSQSPRYDEMQMRQFGEYFESDTLVVITMTYRGPYAEETEAEFLQKQNRYYRFMDPVNILEVNRIKWWLQRFSPLLTNDFESLMQSIFAQVSQEDMDDTVAGYHQTTAENMPSEIERIRRDHLSGLNDAYPAVQGDVWQAYCAMLDMCQENGWQAVLVTPPYLLEYVTCFEDYSEGFSEVFHKTVSGLAEEYGVPFLDYSRDDEFANTYKYFKNIDHLNYYGAEVFGNRFFADLAALGIQVPTE